jgi:hypothetical protein
VNANRRCRAEAGTLVWKREGPALMIAMHMFTVVSFNTKALSGPYSSMLPVTRHLTLRKRSHHVIESACIFCLGVRMPAKLRYMTRPFLHQQVSIASEDSRFQKISKRLKPEPSISAMSCRRLKRQTAEPTFVDLNRRMFSPNMSTSVQVS